MNLSKIYFAFPPADVLEQWLIYLFQTVITNKNCFQGFYGKQLCVQTTETLSVQVTGYLYMYNLVLWHELSGSFTIIWNGAKASL